MGETELQFRTAAIGGFQKQDVLNYIETNNREHTEKVEALKHELDEAIRTRAVAEEEAAAAKRREEAAAAEIARLNGALEDGRRGQEEAQAELARRKTRLAELEALLEDTKVRLAQVEPSAQAYERIKDRTAGMELEAHERAQAIQEEAQEQVKRTRAEVEQWLYKVQAGYDRMRTDLDATLSHTGGELERVRLALEGMGAELAAQDAGLEALITACRENVGPKAPEPLPLEE